MSKKTSTQTTNTSLVCPEEDDVPHETWLVAKRILITLMLRYEKKVNLNLNSRRSETLKAEKSLCFCEDHSRQSRYCTVGSDLHHCHCADDSETVALAHRCF